MTIHGAKGLEFDHVFVVGIGLHGRGDDPRLLNWLELPREQGGDHLLMAPIRVRDETEEMNGEDAINPFIEMLHRERTRAERARLAYVALTRARRSLHLYLHPKVSEEDGSLKFSADSRSLLHSLWLAIGNDMASLPVIGGDPGVPVAEEEILPATTQVRQRLVRRFAPPAPPPDVTAGGDRAPMVPEEDTVEFSWVRQTARRVGTVVHEALERFGRDGLVPAHELPQLRARLESRLEALGVDGEAARSGAERALSALRATLEDAQGRWLFDPAHRDAHSELALSGLRAGQVVNAVIDRTFVDAQGTRWVVDFKTSPHEGGDLQGFLDTEALRYEPSSGVTRTWRAAGHGTGARRPLFPAAGGLAGWMSVASKYLRRRGAATRGIRRGTERDFANHVPGICAAAGNEALHQVGIRRIEGDSSIDGERSAEISQLADHGIAGLRRAVKSHLVGAEVHGLGTNLPEVAQFDRPLDGAQAGAVGELQAFQSGRDGAALLRRKLPRQGRVNDQLRVEVAKFTDTREAKVKVTTSIHRRAAQLEDSRQSAAQCACRYEIPGGVAELRALHGETQALAVPDRSTDFPAIHLRG
jgi:hypothetical protein